MTLAGFLSGPGWTIPDQALHPYPLHRWPELSRAANEAIVEGLGDRVALRYLTGSFGDFEEEAARALAFHGYAELVRRGRPNLKTTTRTVTLTPKLRGGSVASEAEARIRQGLAEAVQRSIFDELEP